MTDHLIQEFLQKVVGLKVLVVGDLMVDRYLWGEVERISPEAPVPVVDIFKEENRLGGAANVALNVFSLGAKPALCGVVGKDKDGEHLIKLAKEKGFDTRMIWSSDQRRTTVKVRVIGNQQQVLRVDKEDRFYLEDAERESFIQHIIPWITEYDVVIFEDYDKGLLHPQFIWPIIEKGREHKIPITVDPKFRHFWDYANCTLFKPNMKELNEGLGKRINKKDITGITDAVASLRKRMPHAQSLITLSEEGVLLIDEDLKAHHVPAHYRDIVDVSGAGDTVISVMSLAIAAGLSAAEAAALANLAGGLVCEEVGVVPISKAKLEHEAQKLKRAS